MEKRKSTVGLLPLYLALYDDALPDLRPRVERFYDIIAGQLEERGLDVARAPVCRLASEFAAAVCAFEKAGADAIITLHLAYSPSLESARVLAGTPLPVIVLDTTPDYAFGPDQTVDGIMANHGIHGAQDMCNVLLRLGKRFWIEAGHWKRSDVLDRVTQRALAARMASAMRLMRVGRIGPAFQGMGDFAVDPEVLRATIGVETVSCAPSAIRSLLDDIGTRDVEEEMAADRAAFDAAGVNPEAHRWTARASLAVRRWMSAERLGSFSVNFLAVDRSFGLPTVPFLEASKAMARGIGYAGEGDVLTAALAGALASFYADTTFTEMFCPDWEGNTVFLSHMGEVNLRVVAGKPLLLEKPFPWTDAANPVVAIGRLRPGKALWVDLAPSPRDTYTLIVSQVTMLNATGEDRLVDCVRGWLRPAMPVADFLADYSRAGGTHHAALVYGGDARVVSGFGQMMGWEVRVL